MNREYKFRGKQLDNGRWIEGYFFQTWERVFILWGTTNGIPDMVEVDPSTVGQFTGLRDKNGREIYEGDIVDISCYIEGYRKKHKSDKCILQLKYCGGVYNLFSLDGNIPYTCISSTYGINPNQIEIIGNIHDTPNC